MFLSNIPSTDALTELTIYKYTKNGIPRWEWTDNSVKYTLESTAPVYSSMAVASIDGDVTMEGDLSVNNITSTNNSTVNINKLCVDELYFGEDKFNPSPAELSTNISYFRCESPLYPQLCVNAVKTDLKVAIADDSGANGTIPYVYVDYNNIGRILFVGVRPIIIPGDYIKNYYPASTSETGKGCFEIKSSAGITINPYNFPCMDNKTKTETINETTVTTYTNTNIFLAPSFDSNGTLTYEVNPTNRYRLATSTYTIYMLAKSFTTEGYYYTIGDSTSTSEHIVSSSNMTMAKGTVDFFTTSVHPDIINLAFHPDKSVTLDQTNISRLYMVIDGFRFSAINMNATDNWKDKYTSVTSYTKSST